METQWIIFILVGLLCGTFGSALGLGSGIILVPMLVILFGFQQKVAQGTTLAMMVPMALVGALRYKAHPEVEIDLHIALWLSIGAIFGALLGSSLALAVPEVVLKRVFALVLVIAAVHMALDTRKQATPKTDAAQDAPTALVERDGTPTQDSDLPSEDMRE
jgi:uncharacterized membrane protein YfcA